MEYFSVFLEGLLNLLTGLEKFFFTPLVSLHDVVFADIPILGDITKVTTHKGLMLLIELIPAIGEWTVASLFLGGGITILLIWRLWKFIGDGFGL